MSGSGRVGMSGLLARWALGSKLTPLIIVISLALGVFSIATMAREADPTISVPSVAVTVAWPGHSAAEVDERIARPVGTWLREIPTVEHITSAASDDGAQLALQFFAANKDEDAITGVRARLDAHASELPRGAQIAGVSLVGADDVPALSITFWNDHGTPMELRRVVAEIAKQLESFADVSTVDVIGGTRRAFDVRLDPTRLAAFGATARDVAQALENANSELPAGFVDGPGGRFAVRAGSRAQTAAAFAATAVRVSDRGVVRLEDVADVTDSSADTTQYVSYAGRETNGAQRPAATLALRKVRGSNASALDERVLTWLHTDGRAFMTGDIHYAVVNDTGATASEKVHTLVEHMAIALAVVVAVVGIALGKRAALIVGIVIPVTLAFVPFVYKMTGFTLNRITLAAMIFAIGILVDDAIVILENVHRHFENQKAKRAEVDWKAVAVDAVQEVGNPTMLATVIVIAALMPTAMTSGATGQFMRALPIGASVAMAYSLLIALTLTPYLAYRVLRPKAKDDAAPAESQEPKLPAWVRAYGRGVRFVLTKRSHQVALLGGAVLLLGGVFALLGSRTVIFKNMPASNIDRTSIVLNFPSDFTISKSNRLATAIASSALVLPEVTSVETYSGIGGPIDAQGLARGYGARTGAQQAELQVQLLPNSDRKRTSHEIAGTLRELAASELAGTGATFTIAEEPLGPPVQAALVAEIYAPTEPERIAMAEEMKDLFRERAGVVDVDWTATPGPPQAVVAGAPDLLAANALAGATIAQDIGILVRGAKPAELSLLGESEVTSVNMRIGPRARLSPSALGALSLTNGRGRPVPMADVARVDQRPGSRILLRKDLEPVVYATAEMSGNASSLYPMMDLSKVIPSRGGALANSTVSWDESRPKGKVVRWGGEWTPTFEMNRDLGQAFVVCLVIIYLMLVAWYGSYATPLVVMLPIPLALIGIVPAHWIAGLPLSGMGTIGIIALAGLMVRNSILIVDFARHHADQGMPIIDAVILAGEERARPILLTAATVVLGDGMLFFDPLLQGLGLTMASGALVSTVLTLFVVPVAYAMLRGFLSRRARGTDAAVRTPSRNGSLEAGAVVVLIVALTAIPRPAAALQPLHDFVAAAQETGNDSRRARASSAQADAEASAALGQALPSIDVRGIFGRTQLDAQLPGAQGAPATSLLPQNIYLASASITIPVSVGAWDRVAAADASARAAVAGERASRLRVERTITRLYCDLLGAEAVRFAVNRRRELAISNAHAVKARVAAGDTSSLDAARARADVARAERDMADAETNVVRARRQLASATGIEPSEATATDMPADDLHDPGAFAAWASQDGDARPAVLQAAATREGSEKSLANARASWLPTVALMVSENYSNATEALGRKDFYTALGIASWHFDLSNGPTVRAQRAALDGARAAESQARIDANDAVYSAWLQVGNDVKDATFAKTEVEAAAQSAELARVQYVEGAATQVDVLQAEQSLLDAEVARVRIVADLAYARVALRLSVADGRAR